GASIKELRIKDVMSEKFVTIAESESLSDAIGKMRKCNVYELMVVKDGTQDKIVGVLTYDLMVKRKKLAMATKVGHVMSTAPSIKETDKVVEVSEKLLYTDTRTLPVTKAGKIMGVVSRKDIAKSLMMSREVTDMAVSTVMTPNPKTVMETDKVAKAVEIMRNLDERFVPVLDKQNRLAGVLGSRELVNLHTKREKTTRGDTSGKRETPDVVVSSLMRHPITVDENTPVSRAVQLMHDRNIPSVLITENGNLKGLITEEDLLELVVSLKEREGVFVQLSGLENVDSDVYDTIYEIVGKSMKKIAKLWSPQTLMMHFTMHNTDGGEAKHSVHVRLNTKKTVFYASAVNWNIYAAVDEALDEMEHMARKEREKLKKQR
ncbi:MAG: CBS domain-containing protein, partial [Candidatus Thermoplasmatota archaeon]|nr:CBS domain-containing protein [Candidatus Thermoplasmatota archaeon]